MRVPLIAEPAVEPVTERAVEQATGPTPAAPPPPDTAPVTTVAAVHTALPPHRYPQDRLTEPIGDLCLTPGADRAVLRRLHASSGVRTRHLALPIERYAALRDFRESNEAWLTAGLDLGTRALTTALDQAGLAPADVDLLVCASITGVAAPSLDARLAGHIGLRPDVKRLPVFGLGCAAGAAGLARVHDYLRGHPGETAVLLTVELCSLTLQKGDDSRANLVAGALFGDGAAALVARATATGTEAEPAAPSGPAVVATRSHLYPDTGHLLGWDVGAGGFRVVIDPGVPALVRRHLGAQVRGFLAEHGLGTGDIGAWVCHPGGPKVLEAVADALALPDDALTASRRSLAVVGNLSSASVLHILQGFTEAHRPMPGTWGLVLAMGPGFASELVLLRW